MNILITLFLPSFFIPTVTASINTDLLHNSMILMITLFKTFLTNNTGFIHFTLQTLVSYVILT